MDENYVPISDPVATGPVYNIYKDMNALYALDKKLYPTEEQKFFQQQRSAKQLSSKNSPPKSDSLLGPFYNSKNCTICNVFGHNFSKCPSAWCLYCRNWGHIAANCTKRVSAAGPCRICKDPSHLAETCPSSYCTLCHLEGHRRSACPQNQTPLDRARQNRNKGTREGSSRDQIASSIRETMAEHAGARDAQRELTQEQRELQRDQLAQALQEPHYYFHDDQFFIERGDVSYDSQGKFSKTPKEALSLPLDSGPVRYLQAREQLHQFTFNNTSITPCHFRGKIWTQILPGLVFDATAKSPAQILEPRAYLPNPLNTGVGFAWRADGLHVHDGIHSVPYGIPDEIRPADALGFFYFPAENPVVWHEKCVHDSFKHDWISALLYFFHYNSRRLQLYRSNAKGHWRWETTDWEDAHPFKQIGFLPDCALPNAARLLNSTAPTEHTIKHLNSVIAPVCNAWAVPPDITPLIACDMFDRTATSVLNAAAGESWRPRPLALLRFGHHDTLSYYTPQIKIILYLFFILLLGVGLSWAIIATWFTIPPFQATFTSRILDICYHWLDFLFGYVIRDIFWTAVDISSRTVSTGIPWLFSVAGGLFSWTFWTTADTAFNLGDLLYSETITLFTYCSPILLTGATYLNEIEYANYFNNALSISSGFITNSYELGYHCTAALLPYGQMFTALISESSGFASDACSNVYESLVWPTMAAPWTLAYDYYYPPQSYTEQFSEVVANNYHVALAGFFTIFAILFSRRYLALYRSTGSRWELLFTVIFSPILEEFVKHYEPLLSIPIICALEARLNGDSNLMLIISTISHTLLTMLPLRLAILIHMIHNLIMALYERRTLSLMKAIKKTVKRGSPVVDLGSLETQLPIDQHLSVEYASDEYSLPIWRKINCPLDPVLLSPGVYQNEWVQFTTNGYNPIRDADDFDIVSVFANGYGMYSGHHGGHKTLLYMVHKRLLGLDAPVKFAYEEQLCTLAGQWGLRQIPTFQFAECDSLMLHLTTHYRLERYHDKKRNLYIARPYTKPSMLPIYFDLWTEHLDSGKRREARDFKEEVLGMPFEVVLELCKRPSISVKTDELMKLGGKPRPLLSFDRRLLMHMATWSWIGKIAFCANWRWYADNEVLRYDPQSFYPTDTRLVSTYLFAISHDSVQVSKWLTHVFFIRLQHKYGAVDEDTIRRGLYEMYCAVWDGNNADMSFNVILRKYVSSLINLWSKEPAHVSHEADEMTKRTVAHSRYGDRLELKNTNPTGIWATTNNNTFSFWFKYWYVIETLYGQSPVQFGTHAGDDFFGTHPVYDTLQDSTPFLDMLMRMGMAVTGGIRPFLNVDYLGMRFVPAYRGHSFYLAGIVMRFHKIGTFYSDVGRRVPYETGYTVCKMWERVTRHDPIVYAWVNHVLRVCEAFRDPNISPRIEYSKNPLNDWFSEDVMLWYEELRPHPLYYAHIEKRFGLQNYEVDELVNFLWALPPVPGVAFHPLLGKMFATDCA